ncbi:MAG: carbohydrate ABC transporter permease [Aestuariivirga sp.]
MADAAAYSDLEAARAARSYLIGRVAIYGFLALFALIYLMPLCVVILNSFRTNPEISANGLIAWPDALLVDAWPNAWGTYCLNGRCEGMAQNFWNSVYMTIPATFISTLLGMLNGYILSKWRFRGSNALFTFMMFGVFMPGQIALMPWAYILGTTGLNKTMWGLVLVHVIQGLSFTTLFARNFYVSIPDDLIKAARIDGAGFWRIFWKIIMPLSPPILIVTVIWQFTGIWNEFLYGVVLTTGKTQPVTAAIVAFSQSGQTVREYDVMSAGVLIAALPPLLIYLFGGKYFVRGLTQGAVK